MVISIFDYLTQYRIEMAKNMLKDPYVKIYQIAEKIGYTSTAHFCLIFKKYTGISPASYRQHAGL
jgi:two-component system response regulator YesN